MEIYKADFLKKRERVAESIDHFKENIKGLELTVEQLQLENSEATGDIATARAEVCLSHSHACMYAVILLSYHNLGGYFHN